MKKKSKPKAITYKEIKGRWKARAKKKKAKPLTVKALVKKLKKKAPKKKAGKTPSKSRALALKKGRGIHLDFPAEVTPTQLTLFGDLKYEEWDQTLYKVAQVRDGGNWWVGDALNYGDTHFGEVYTQAASETGMSEDTLQRLKYVSSRVSPVNRIKELTWSHHREVAKCTEDEQVRWLGMALEKGWNVAALKEAMRKKGQKTASEGDGEQLDMDKGCVSCHASVAPMKICASCAALPVKAIQTVGIEAASNLLDKRAGNGESPE